jgi:hypothetical protein
MTSIVSLPLEPEFKFQIRGRDDHPYSKMSNVVLFSLPGSLVPQFKFFLQNLLQI